MLQSMGVQRVRHNLATEQKQNMHTLVPFLARLLTRNNCFHESTSLVSLSRKFSLSPISCQLGQKVRKENGRGVFVLPLLSWYHLSLAYGIKMVPPARLSRGSHCHQPSSLTLASAKGSAHICQVPHTCAHNTGPRFSPNAIPVK